MTNYFFIGGVPQSGINVIRAIIGSHPHVSIIQFDLPLWRDNYVKHKPYWQFIDNKSLAKKLLSEIYDRNIDCYMHKPDPQVIVDKIDWNSLNTIESYPLLAGTVFRAFFEEYQLKRGLTPFFGLTTPDNEFFADDIFHAFPGARFIHVYNSDILSNVAKMKRQFSWISEHNNPDLDLIDYTLACYNSIDRLIENFQRYHSKYIGLNYSTFVKNQEGYIRIVCSFLGFQFDTSMLEMKGHYDWDESKPIFPMSHGTVIFNTADETITNLCAKEVDLVKDVSSLCEKQRKKVEQNFSIARMESQQLTDMGNILYSPENLEIVVLCYKTAIQADPNFESAYLGLGDICIHKNDTVQALKYYVNSYRITNSNRIAVAMASNILVQLNKACDAIRMCDSYLLEFPDDTEIIGVREQIRNMSNSRYSGNVNIKKTFIDAGAHHGEIFSSFNCFDKNFNVLLDHAHGNKPFFIMDNFKNAQFILIEPNENCIPVLKSAVHDIENVTIINKALWVDSESHSFYISIDRWGDEGSTLLLDKKEKLDSENSCAIKCIDAVRLVEKYKDDYLVIKMDIEGAEYDVLSYLIKNDCLKYVNELYVEWHDRAFPKCQEMSAAIKKHLLIQSDTFYGEWR